jgi:hypothetical protein
MTDRPIIFSAPMVRALLDGRKTQTRRVLKPSDDEGRFWPLYSAGRMVASGCAQAPDKIHSGGRYSATRYAPGDRLWVRETFATWDGGARDLAYRADISDSEWSALLHDRRHGAPWRVRSPIHMPRWASRLTLHVTEVRVQRLQEIDAYDAIREGMSPGTQLPCGGMDRDPVEDFCELWCSLHGEGAWDANPWVCAVSFTVERANIDATTPTGADQGAV